MLLEREQPELVVLDVMLPGTDGLTLCRWLVEAQGGRIWAENRPGGGARVSFTLPAGDRRGRSLELL